MLHSISNFLLHVWVGFLCIGTLKFSCCVRDAAVHCLERERQALLGFKQGLKDPHNRLSSWVGEDCCKWTGIRCNNRTGHVVKLNLQNPYHIQLSLRQIVQVLLSGEVEPGFRRSCLSGEINPSLLELKYLKHLDLSINCFGGISIPKFIGSLKNLRYLNLSRAGFGGMVPHELGNLSALRYLDLNHEAFVWARVNGAFPLGYNLHVDSLHWISHLSSLQHLDMGWVNLSMASDWLHPINMLPSLLNLQLRNCSPGSSPTSLSYVNFTSLSTLDLSDNMLGPRIPAWLFNISRMMSLNLGSNQFKDFIPTELGNLCNLQNLDLSYNSFSGERKRFKECFKGCIRSSLEDLDLGSNELSGYLPNWLGQFTNLKSLDLSFNTFSGSIPPSIGRLSSLRELNLGENSFSGSIPPSLGRLSSLRILYLESNQLDGSISHILVQLSNLKGLDVSNNSFNGVLSEAHFSNLKKLKYLWLSSTSIILNVSSNWVPPFQLTHIQMDNCKLGPQFPPWLRTQNELLSLSFSNASISDTIPDFFWSLSPNISSIDLSNNFITGPIIESVGETTTTNLLLLSLSSNRLKGSIPLSVCKMKDLLGLYLSDNRLTDEIPHCLGDLKDLESLNLNNNNLSGVIPSSISHLSRLESLHLNKNMLSGELPPALRNCRRLVTLDLGENGFSGKIPKWIGEELSSLKFLLLGSNKFDGILPPQLALLSNLQVLDLAQNNITGTIPTSFGNFGAMTIVNRTKKNIYRGNISGGMESITVSWKGGEYEYNTTISLLVNINLSGNDLCGEIPKEIFDLLGLQSLNLSHNHLTGKIPVNISGLRWIESFDLSWNQLSGEIPHSMSYLTSLSRLNLSYNNFSGRIPSGNQLDTIVDSSVVTGNPFLCGPPLLNQCPNDETSHDSKSAVDDEESRDLLMYLFYIGMALGFVVGFWIVCGTLLFKRSWRIAYYGFFDDMGDLLYATVARNVAKFQKK